MSGARKALGQDTILNLSGRFRFSDAVWIDSWQLISHADDAFDGSGDDLAFLEGEPLIGIEPSPLLLRHITEIGDARAALIRSVVAEQQRELSSHALQTLRSYQRRHPLDATVTRETVRGLVRAGEGSQASEVVMAVSQLATTTPEGAPGWVLQLEDLIGPNDGMDAAERRAVVEEQQAEADAARAKLFESAAGVGDWKVALEIALAGLPEAERSSGDPERLRLLEAIPVDEVDGSRKFALCTAMTRHLIYAGRESDARQWARTTAMLARTPDEQLIAHVNASLIHEPVDEFIPSSLLELLDSASEELGSTQSMHVAIVSHFERASFEEAAMVRRRFTAMIENSADQSRRWHVMMLESMSAFLEGHFEQATELSQRAAQFADVFGITEAELGLLGQRANAHWVLGSFPEVPGTAMRNPVNEASVLTRVLKAVALAETDGGSAVNAFVRAYDHDSRAIWSLPVLAAAATSITDQELVPSVLDRLRERSGTSAILGSGVVHLGPVDRVISRLVRSHAEREDLLRAAIDLADRQRTRLWQVVCRLDLSELSNNDEYRAQANDLATTPDLQQMVRDYTQTERYASRSSEP